MKNYCTQVAAEKIVGKKIQLGTSRHEHRDGKIEVITSVGTARNHASALKLAGDWLLEYKGKHLKNMNEEDAAEYLCLLALSLGQSAVDLARQSINFHVLFESPVPFIHSSIHRKLTNRAYSPKQIGLLVEGATPRLQLSILLAADAGLRAHELFTISCPSNLDESRRDGWVADRFSGRDDDVTFVVHGKGGLRRSVKLAHLLALRLQAQLRPQPLQVMDRKVNYVSYFDLLGGSNFSSQFSKLSKTVLGFSHGAHGLRHSFAQTRLHNLMCSGLQYQASLNALSNELGHFSIANTFAYLRD